jgi:hypothetical protein
MRRRQNSYLHKRRLGSALALCLFLHLIALQKSFATTIEPEHWREMLAQLSCEDVQKIDDDAWSVRGQFEIDGRIWTNPVIQGEHLLDFIAKCAVAGGLATDQRNLVGASPITSTLPVFDRANAHNGLSDPQSGGSGSNSSNANQTFVPTEISAAAVPAPIAGTGTVGIVVACIALIGLARRRRATS